MVVHIFSGFALFTELMWQGAFWFTNKRVQIKILPGLNFLNGVRKRRLLAKETSIASCEVLDEKHRIAVQGIYADLHKTNVVIIIKAGGASVKETDLLFAFAFCKKQTRKTGVLARLAVGCLSILINLASQVFRSAVKQQHN